MRYRLFSLMLAFMALAAAPAQAQQAILTGRVTDDQGQALVGANVAVEELLLGAATDADGRYTITVPAERVQGQEVTLTARFVGYANASRKIALTPGRQTVDLQLGAGLLDLDEIVVTALGIEREQRSLGYAVQNVESDAVTRANESNLVNALAGKVAGVQINSSSGQPGKASRITIRGVSSFLGENQPLFVIDGVPVSNDEDDNPGGSEVFTGGTSNRLVDIDPNIIENVTILKGASATALYGSRASNGAVVITTKGGRIGAASAPRITFSSRVRWDEAILKGFQNEYLQGQNGFYQNGLPLAQGGYVQPGAVSVTGARITNPQTTLSWGPHKDRVDPQVLADLGVEAIPVYDPRDDFYQTGAVLENALSLSGGSAGSSYFLSVGDLRQDGTVPGTRLDRTSILAKFSTRLSDRLGVETSANYIRTNNDWLNEGNGARSFLYGLNFAPISFDITQRTNPNGTQRNWTTSFNNPLWLTDNSAYRSGVDRIIASTAVNYTLLPWLTLNERLGIDTYTDKRKEEYNVGVVGRPAGSMFDQKISRREVNSDLTLQADRRVSGKVRLTALVGNNFNDRYYNYDFIDGDNLSIPGFYNVSNASVVTATEYTSRRRLVSLYGQGTLDYDDYAYLTFTARNDWSSTLPADRNSYFYPSVSAGLVFTDAFNVSGPLSYGKVRASVAQVGSDAPVYSLTTPFVQANPGDGQRGNINYPYNGQNGFRLTNVLGNPDLKPEISTEYEVGTDLRFFGQRARVDLAYYTRSTKDQIFNVPVSAATGYLSRLINAGEIRNSGIELVVGATPVQTRAFNVDLQANFTKNRTEVVELAEGVDNIFLAGFTSPQIRVLPGEKGYGVIWGSRFARNDAGDILIDDQGYPIEDDELGPIGYVQPDWQANLRANLGYKNLQLSALVDVVRGGDILNFDLFYSTFYGTSALTADRGTEQVFEGVNVNTGQPNTVPVVKDELFYRSYYSNIYEFFVEDGSYVKLREVSLTYTLPQRWVRSVGLQGASFTATGRNLWIDSDFTYGDPEGSLFGSGNGQGFYHMVTPSTRSYSFGFRLSF